VIISPVVPVFTYNEVEVKKTVTTSDGSVKNHEFTQIKLKNHTLRIKDDFGQVVTLDGAIYRAKKIVFRSPAEHTINGKKYDMEMQIIHQGESSGDIAKHVILCFLFEIKAGVFNKFIDDIDYFSLPNIGNPAKNLENDLFIPKILFSSDSEDIPMMKPFSMYSYQGSLTAPPCTQSTIVYVAADPIPIGSTAVKLFEEALRVPDMMSSKGDVIISNVLPINARKTQPLNGRQVFYFEKEPEDKVPIITQVVQPAGHYEKVTKRLNNYYFVNTNAPSGMPGALVVSEAEAKGTR